MKNTNTPVLFIVFNRPNTTKVVFDAIRKAKPQKLYVAADGPRKGNKEDDGNCALVKEIVKQIDWECQVHYRFSEINQGCGPGPANAITWAFENEDRLIILEDDCVPAQSFFLYCNELLERYKNDSRIWLISGNQYNEEAVTTQHSYFFSKYGHSWGWATWKRCWLEMDLSLSKYPKINSQDLFKSAYRTKEEFKFFQKKINTIYKNESLKSHIWDFQFGFAVSLNGGLCIVPRNNLVKNIGYFGTHSSKKDKLHNLPIDENYSIISHPDFVLPDVNYDAYHFKHHWKRKKPFLKRILKRIKIELKRIE
jgi:hypothetical protein